jgi:pyridoxal phosphate enzyme (YggS family)
VIPTLQTNLADVRSRIDRAALRSGRRGAEIDLVAITKTVEPEVAAELVKLGQEDLGENRAAELERKEKALRAAGLAPRWHFVGHLQGNKVRRVVAIAASIHSIDSLRLLEAVDRAAGELGKRPEVWVQVKLSPEPTKTGLERRDVKAVFARAAACENVRLAGVMALAPVRAPVGAPAGTEASARAVFRELSSLARDLARASGMRDAHRPGRVRTSMGMSGDFEWAIEEGSDLVRIGSLLFEGCGSTGRNAT